MAAPSLSIIIPCFNEEGNVAETVADLTTALKGLIDDYEMIIFNDCSSDNTKHVIDELASKNSKIRPIHNPRNMGLGYNYRKGVELASKEYVVMVPGDNEVVATSIREMCLHIGEADIIIPYVANFNIRPLYRQAISRTFTATINTLFGQRIHYYNGPVLHKTAILRKVPMNTDGFAYQAEILIRLVRMGHTYCEVPILLRRRKYGSSRALSRKNLSSVAKTIYTLAMKK